MVTINKNDLYRFPWSKTDNPGGWIEVTDKCDISCEGCYRHQIEGHRPLSEIKQDIIRIKELTNCDFITLAGGEPLIYPSIMEVIEYITSLGLKSVIFSNGEKFTHEFGLKLKKAGLSKIHFHIDSGQSRPGWENKSEADLNELRQHFADIIYRIKGLQCGFHITVYRYSLKEMPKVISWVNKNIHKVQHISLIAFRGFPLNDSVEYYVKGVQIKPDSFQNSSNKVNDINITTEEIYNLLLSKFQVFKPCAYLNGTSNYETYKFLIIVNLGTKFKRFGSLGKKTIELAQVFHHLFKGKYFTFMNRADIGKKVFAVSLFDKNVRQAFYIFCQYSLKNPLRIFNKIYLQSIHIQQPSEVLDGKINLCDDCVNMSIYKGNLVNPCQMDEYRLYGGPLVVMSKT